MEEQILERLIREFSTRGSVVAGRADEIARSLGTSASIVELDRDGAPAPDAEGLAAMIDHTALKPETTPQDVERLCEEAAYYGFASVCVNPCYVPLAARLLAGTSVAVCSVVGFPLGASRSSIKARESEAAVADGAHEIDMVLNVGMLKSRHFDYVEADILYVVESVGEGIITKVILETALLTDEEKVAGCMLARRAGASFVKTSTGFSKGGATVADVALMRRVVGDSMGVKAAGGIRTAADARAMIAAGANRIGASSSVAIVGGTARETARGGSSEY